MLLYHGTARSNLSSVARSGLRAPLWVAKTLEAAANWAQLRSAHWVGNQRVTPPVSILRFHWDGDLYEDTNTLDPNLGVLRDEVPAETIDVLVGSPWTAARKRWRRMLPVRTNPSISLEIVGDPRGFDVVLTRRGRKVGKLTAEHTSNTLCQDDLEEMRHIVGDAFLDTYVVTGARIDAVLFNQGAGLKMYLEAIHEAARRGGVLAPHVCIGVGGTSTAAMRVWNSKRLSEHVLRVGRLVYWAG